MYAIRSYYDGLLASRDQAHSMACSPIKTPILNESGAVYVEKDKKRKFAHAISYNFV